jgi:precorrin-8X/cobalt-precorrin-8 methylmutase
MEWHSSDIQSLHLIDQEIGGHHFSPAEYEIIRQVIYATGDFDYQSLIQFSPQALPAGVAALSVRTPIIVDVPSVQMGVLPQLQATFANPVYCGSETFTRPQVEKSRAAFGVETLSRRHPTAIFVIGASQTTLPALMDLVQTDDIKPALIIHTPVGFLSEGRDHLAKSWVPHIMLTGRKGGPSVAAAILNGLLDLAWGAYGHDLKEQAKSR